MEPVISAVVLLAAAVVVLKKIVDLITHWVTAIHGPGTVALAVVVGVLIAWFFDYNITDLLIAEAGLPAGRDLPLILDYVVSGVAMAGFAGLLNDNQKARAAASVGDLDANTNDPNASGSRPLDDH